MKDSAEPGRLTQWRLLVPCALLLLPLLAPALSSAQAAPEAQRAPEAGAEVPATRPAEQLEPTPAASPAQADRPLLRELNRETRELYGQLQAGVLRVQIPETAWARNALAQNNWLTDKYRNLSPEVRQQLTDPPGGNTLNGNVVSNSGSNSTGGNTTEGSNGRQGLTIIVPPPNGSPASQPQGGQGGQAAQVPERQPPPGERRAYAAQVQAPAQQGPQAPQVAGPSFSPNNIGLLLDEQGHVLVPQFIDRDALGDQPMHLTGPSGAVLEGRLVGADLQTGLSVLQLIRPAAKSSGKAEPKASDGNAMDPKTAEPASGGKPGAEKPVVLAKSKPTDGSLVLLLSPADGTGRLGVWSGGGRDYGVVVNIDGRVAGINRSGQFLGGPACQLIADQIIRNGAVRRATLGVIITQIEKDDPLRRAQPLLADRPAVRVDQVMLHSAAEQGGLKQGDVLLALDGEPASDIPTLAATIAAKNGRTRFRVLRGNQLLDLAVDLQQK